MRFREELNFKIAAPIEAVWREFVDFAAWPQWSHTVREVGRLGNGWRFRAKGQPLVDLVFVLEALRRDVPQFLEFRSITEYPHNLDAKGWVQFEEDAFGFTHLHLVFEGGPHYESAILNNLANWWVSTFDEPTKMLSLTLEEFKAHLERQHPIHLAATARRFESALD